MLKTILMNVTLFHAKLFVNTYTAVTLPFYAAVQKPWRRLKLANVVRAKMIKQPDNKIVWVREGKPGKLPALNCSTYLEAFKNLDPSKTSIGIRDVLEERYNYDEEGLPVVVDGKVLRKVVLADKYRWMTVRETLDKVDNLAKGFYDLGVRRGDKVIIYAETQPDWFFACLAVSKVGASVVTLFSNLGRSGVVYGMNQTKAKFIITTEELKDQLLEYIGEVPDVEKLIYFIGKNFSREPSKATIPKRITVKSFEEIETTGAKMAPMQFDLPNPDDLALVMYTSGTTSLPKAVMITHRTLMSNIKGMTVAFEDNNYNFGDTTLASFLPLSHIFGFVFNIFMFINGAKVAFASPFTLLNSSPSHVPDQVGDLRLIQPNVFVVVPLVLERFQKEIYAKLNKKSFLAAPLFTYFMEYKKRWLARGFQTPIINRLICRKIKEEFGSKLEVVGVGGAALHASMQTFTECALDVELINGYGCTETCGGVYITHLDELALGSCGTPIEGVFARLEDWPEGGYMVNDKPNQRGEVVIGGETVASGYYEMPEETKEAFYTDSNGVRWFYTGDIGEIDPKYGRLRIVDRKKDLAKLANGEYVSLGKIETALRSSRYVENICICTEMFSNDLVALISPNRKVLKELAKTLNKAHLAHEQRCTDPEIVTVVHASIKESGQRSGLKPKELPARITLTPETWTPENDLLTAAFKLKRKKVYKFYHKEIQAMFESLGYKSSTANNS